MILQQKMKIILLKMMICNTGFSANAPRLGDLETGAEIQALDSRINKTNTPRVRYEVERNGEKFSCWVSTENGKGGAIMEKRPGPSVDLPGARGGEVGIGATFSLNPTVLRLFYIVLRLTSAHFDWQRARSGSGWRRNRRRAARGGRSGGLFFTEMGQW